MVRYLILGLFCCIVLQSLGQIQRNHYFNSTEYQKIYEDEDVVEFIMSKEYIDTTFPLRPFATGNKMLGPIPNDPHTGILDGVYINESPFIFKKLAKSNLANNIFDQKDSLFLSHHLLIYNNDSAFVEHIDVQFSVDQMKFGHFKQIILDEWPQNKTVKFYDRKMNLIRILNQSENACRDTRYFNDTVIRDYRFIDNTIFYKTNLNNTGYYFSEFDENIEWRISEVNDSIEVTKGYDKNFNLASLYINKTSDNKDILYHFDENEEIIGKKIRYHNSKITYETYERFYTLECYKKGSIQSLEIKDLKTGKISSLHWNKRGKIDEVMIDGKEIE